MGDNFNPTFRESMKWLHTWVGLVLSAVLYFIFVTGSFGYFNKEVNHWMTPETMRPSSEIALEDTVKTGLNYLEKTAPNAARYSISPPYQREPTRFRVSARLKSPNDEGKTRIRAQLDLQTGEIKEPSRDTGGGDALYAMHYSLHYMPNSMAIYIVGLATLFMLIALITGIVIHRTIFVDFFTLRLYKKSRSWLDAHTISSVLALPFFLMITYSGLLFFSLDYSPGISLLAYSGDIEQAKKEIRSHRRPPLSKDGHHNTAPSADLSGPLNTFFTEWPEAEIRTISIENPGTHDAVIKIVRWADSLSRRDAEMLFSGVTGKRLKNQPSAPMDVFVYSALINMHEAHFANIYLRWMYFLSGLVGAAMIATGLQLWVSKRRKKILKKNPNHFGFALVERSNLGIILGLPFAIGIYFWANRLLPVNLENRADWELHSLFIAWSLSFFYSGIRPLNRAWPELSCATALIYMFIPVLNAFTTDTHLVHSLNQGDWQRVGFDLSAMIFGASLFVIYQKILSTGKARSRVSIVRPSKAVAR